MGKTIKLNPEKEHWRSTLDGIQITYTFRFEDGTSGRFSGYETLAGNSKAELARARGVARAKLVDKIQKKADEIQCGVAYETGQMTVQALILDYMEKEREGSIKSRKTGKVKAITTCDAADRRLKCYVLPYKPLMTKKISTLTVRDCMQYHDWLEGLTRKNKGKDVPLSADTLNKSIALVDRAISPYFKRIGENNPMDSVERFIVHTKRKTEDDILNKDELQAFIRYCMEDTTDHNRMQGLVQVLVYCREGELFGFKVKDFIPEKRILQVRRRVYRDKHGKPVLGADGDLKNENAYRDIALCDQAYNILTQLCDGKKPDDLIFTNPDGTLINARCYQRWFDRTKKLIGISDDRKLPVYNLRATGITFALVSCGIESLEGISANAGHSDTKTTMKYYKAKYFEQNISAADKMTMALNSLMNTVCIEG